MSRYSNVFVTIMAGGQGARFWPVSRKRKPKQFLSITESGETLIQVTADRYRDFVPNDQIYVVTNGSLADQVRACIPHAQIICEPQPKNTAAALGLAAIHLHKKNPESIMIALPADHAIPNKDELLRIFGVAIEYAADHDSLVTLGVKPTFAHTGYGYIKRGNPLAGEIFEVNTFVEKPSQEVADKYFHSGEYYWNSGMFVWRTSVLLDSIKSFMPDLYAGLLEIQASLGTASETETTKQVFSKLASVSIDYGVLEHARHCAVIEAKDLHWSDIGSWDVWAEFFPADQNGNVTIGESCLIESKNCVVHSPRRFTAVLGLNDVIVIDSEDGLLVCHRSKVQDVKKVVDELVKRKREDLV